MNGSFLDQWIELLIKFSVKRKLASATFADIVVSYGGEGRYYHNLDHIGQVLETVANLEYLADDYPAIQLAAWFHDIIYNTHRSDNEFQSAVYAQSLLTKLNVPDEIIIKVQQMIIATANHLNPTQTPDIYILLDADLVILGSDETTFEKYCQAIRNEYGWVLESIYRPARINIMRKFLERPRIYYTEVLFERFEDMVRKNLLGEIVRLS